MTDDELLGRLRDGDETAFDQIFRAHYASLVRLVETMLRDSAIAEETVQDVLLELWRRRKSLVIEDSLRAYLFRAARNRALNHVRHQQVVQRSEPYLAFDAAVARGAHEDLVEQEIDAALREAVRSLPDRCREVFELSRTHGLRYAEIAHTLGISVKTVESQMGKALRVLREKLAPWLASDR